MEGSRIPIRTMSTTLYYNSELSCLCPLLCNCVIVHTRLYRSWSSVSPSIAGTSFCQIVLLPSLPMPIFNSPSLTLPIGLSVHYRLYWLCANFQCRLRILNHKMETCFLSKKQLKLKKIAYLSLKNLHVTFNLHSPYPCTPQRELHIPLCISRRTSQSLLMTWVWRLPCHTIKGPLQTRDFLLSFSFSLSRFRSRSLHIYTRFDHVTSFWIMLEITWFACFYACVACFISWVGNASKRNREKKDGMCVGIDVGSPFPSALSFSFFSESKSESWKQFMTTVKEEKAALRRFSTANSS